MQPRSAIRHAATAILAVASGCGVGNAETSTGLRPAAATLARPCFACHADREPSVIPVLRGQPVERFLAKMQKFKETQNPSMMHRIAMGYREDDLHGIAVYFRSLQPQRSK